MPRLLLLNHVILLLCASIYLGTGISLWFFQLPLEPKLTVDNYFLLFVEPVTAATWHSSSAGRCASRPAPWPPVSRSPPAKSCTRRCARQPRSWPSGGS